MKPKYPSCGDEVPIPVPHEHIAFVQQVYAAMVAAHSAQATADNFSEEAEWDMYIACAGAAETAVKAFLRYHFPDRPTW